MNIQSGIISNWNDEKGFGFITPKSGGKTIFTHINDFSKRHKRPIRGLEVEYKLSADSKGRKCAVDVRPLEGHTAGSFVLKQRVFSVVLFICFASMLFILFDLSLIPIEIVYLYAVMSVIAFLMYAKDKSAAEWGEWRTSESTLHAISLVGGWPGACIAQSYLRHKSKKTSFKVTYWVTIIVNCGGLWWLITPEGSMWLKNIMNNIKFG